MSDPKYIRFIDPEYKTLFWIPDGGRIQITNWRSAKVCRFIDVCHTDVGGNYYHICEFAERMRDAGATYLPIDYIHDATFYRALYLSPVKSVPKPPYYVLDETQTHGFAYCPTSRAAHRYCIFERLEGGGIGQREFYGNIRDAAPKQHGFDVQKIKAVTGRPRKQRDAQER